MAETRVVGARIANPLLDGARTALGLPETSTDTEIVRHALAKLAGLDARDYARPPGRPRPCQREGDAVT